MMIHNIKKYKFSDVFFYNQKGSNTYKMIDCRSGNLIGEMTVSPRIDLYISNLNISPECRRQGYGTKFLNFAKILSEKMGLNGNLRVIAGTTDDTQNPSYIFYRKYGFSCENKKILEKIDKHISIKKQLDFKKMPLIYMLYKSAK